MNSSNNLQLIFPEFEYKLTKKEGKLFIYDPIAKKYRALSPEEWVRQHCLNYLTNHLGYPATNIQIERAFKVNKLVRRTDIQVFNSLGEFFKNKLKILLSSLDSSKKLLLITDNINKKNIETITIAIGT